MGNLVQHIHCDKCGSSDGNALYEDGSTYCFVCESYGKGDGQVEEKSFMNETFNQVVAVPIANSIRGISPSTYKEYSYGKDDKGNHLINHYDSNGNIVAQKIRYPDKTFSWTGNAKEAVPFGMNKWRSGGKRIYITEGELDCLSIAEAVKCKYPVISINNGAAAAAKDLKKHIEFLDTYEEIVLWFDNDEPGKKATQQVASLFKPGKVYTCSTTEYKDANELLQAKGVAAVLKEYYELKRLTPDGIVNASSISFDELTSLDVVHSYMTPYHAINTKLKGVRKGELLTIVAGSGLGKSTLTRELAYDLLMNKELTIGYVALEENNRRSALGFMGIDMNTSLHLQETLEATPKDKLQESYNKVIGSNRLYLYNHFGSLDSDNLMSKLRYLAVGSDCDFIILDHISIVVSGLEDMGDNERRTIDVLMTKLRSLVEETGVGMIIVSHLKRPQGGKGHEDGLETSLSHLRGSASIGQLSDGVVGLERNQQGDTPDVANVRILKNRYAGDTGIGGQVRYYKEQGRLLDYTSEFSNETTGGNTKEDF